MQFLANRAGNPEQIVESLDGDLDSIRRQDFLRFWYRDTPESSFDFLLDPLGTDLDSTRRWTGSLLEQPGCAHLPALIAEKSGKLDEAVAKRPLSGFDVGTCLAWSRIARLTTDMELLCTAEVHLASLLPEGHPRRIEALEKSAAGASLVDRHPLALQASYLLYLDNPGEDALRHCIDYAISAQDMECLRHFIILAQYIIPDEERTAICTSHLPDFDPELLSVDPSSAPVPALLAKKGVLDLEPLEAPENLEPVEQEVPAAMWTEDASLLLELGISNPDPGLYSEAAVLFLMAGEKAAAAGAMEDLPESHPVRTLLAFSSALIDRDAALALSSGIPLIPHATEILPFILSEISLVLDEPLPEEVAKALPDGGWRTKMDLCLRHSDWEGLSSLARNAPDDPEMKFCLARALQEQNPGQATELYLQLLQTDLARSALFQILRLAWRQESSMFLKPALLRLEQICTDPIVTLEKLRAGMETTELPAHPLVLACAFSRGLIPATAMVEMVSAPTAIRLLAWHALTGNGDVSAEMERFEGGATERELIGRLALMGMDPAGREARLAMEPTNDPLLLWWTNRGEENSGTMLDVMIAGELRKQESFDPLVLEGLPEELKPVYTEWLQLRFGERTPLCGDISLQRLLAFARGDGDRMELLESESTEADPNSPAAFGRLLLDPLVIPEEDAPWILACHRRETALMPVAQAWAPAFSSGDPKLALLAWRAGIAEELQSDDPTGNWTGLVDPVVLERIQSRWTRRRGLPEPVAPGEDMDDVQAGLWFLHGMLNGQEDPEYLRKRTEPVLQQMYKRALFRSGFWADLTRLALDLLEGDPDENEKADCYRQLVRIDSEGRSDEDSSTLTRRTLAEFHPQDSFNLLLLLDQDRLGGNPESELNWFQKLASTRTSTQERVAFTLEAWRLELVVSRTLPTRNAVADLVALDTSDSCLNWWAFCVLGEEFPYVLASREYASDTPAGMVFLRRALAQGEYETGREVYTELTDIWPEELPLLHQVLGLALATGDGLITGKTLEKMSLTAFTVENERVEHLYLAGLAMETWAEDPEGALAIYRRVLELQPDHEAFLRSRSILQRAGQAENLATLLSDRSHSETREDVLARILSDLADLQLEALMNRTAARETLMRLDRLVPDHKPGLGTLSQLHEEAGEYGHATDTLGRWLKLETDPFVRCSICRRMGSAEQMLEHPKEALGWFLQSLELDPEQLDLWEKVVDLNLQLKDAKKAVWSLRKCLTLQRNVEVRVGYLQRLSDIQENLLKDQRTARESLVEAVDISDGSLPAVESLVHFYERHADSPSRNIKLDLLWTSERQKIVRLDSASSVNRLAHFAFWKRNDTAAGLLAECASQLGADPAELPCKPATHPMDTSLLHAEDLENTLYPLELLQTQRRMIRVVHDEARRHLRDLFRKSMPAKSERIRQMPGNAIPALEKSPKNMEFYRHEGTTPKWLPLDPPVLLLPGSWDIDAITENQWRFLLSGYQFLEDARLSIPLALSTEQMVHFLAALVMTVFPDRRFEGMDASLLQEFTKYTQKIVGRKDRDLLAGTILEMGSFGKKDLDSIEDSLLRTVDRVGYLAAGAWEPVQLSLGLFDRPERPLKLLQYAVSQVHFQLRETALVVQMRG